MQMGPKGGVLVRVLQRNCINRGGRDREKKWERGRRRDFTELALTVWELACPKPAGQAGRQEDRLAGKRHWQLLLQSGVQRQLEEALLPQGTSVFSLKALYGLDEVYWYMEGHLLYSKSDDLGVNYIWKIPSKHHLGGYLTKIWVPLPGQLTYRTHHRRVWVKFTAWTAWMQLVSAAMPSACDHNIHIHEPRPSSPVSSTQLSSRKPGWTGLWNGIN